MAELASELLTERLRLRVFEPSDVAELCRLAGDKRIADTTLRIPHPYGEKDAEAMIERVTRGRRERTELNLAVTERDGGALAGSCSLKLNLEHESAELGYWIGVPFWGRGYATEAARALVEHGCEQLDLHRIEAFCMLANPASARILEKVGMRREGTQRDGIKKNGVFADVGIYALLASEVTSAERRSRSRS